ncbi:TetM/TetW/TetO/TetS family tetracycline resistance ribosomal protection protein [Glycomyces albus]
MQRFLNLGILAHVDAGKTSLTERLLYEAGVIDEVGSVDQGSTRTDSLTLERRRGITIKSAVVSFVLGDLTVNLIDTPGHPDFIAEVERVLGVLDGAVLVVSAVEGVQAQTRILFRALRRLGVPTLIFVNKIDRTGARCDTLLRDLAGRLDPAAIALVAVDEIGTRDARAVPRPLDPAFRAELTELLTEHDEALLTDYVRDERALEDRRLLDALAAQTEQAIVHPIYFGSAVTGAGVERLADGLRDLLPSASGDPAGPVSGSVFKVERGPAGDKIAYTRLFSGTLRVRDRIAVGAGAKEGHRRRRLRRRRRGAERRGRGRTDRQAPRPGVGPHRRRARRAPGRGRRALRAARAGDRRRPREGRRPGALHTALTRLAEQDPLIGLRHDPIRSRLSLSLYGEVQKEVIGSTLEEEHGLEVAFEESTVICVERPIGSGEAAEFIAADGNPFLATVGLRLEPAPPGTGIGFRLGVELGSMPPAFFTAVEETVHETLTQGLCGWQVRDCAVTMTHSGYWARQSSSHGVFDKSMSSTAGDFRGLTPLILMDALRQAGTEVLEPIHRFRIDLPTDALGPVLAMLSKLRAVPEAPLRRGDAYTLEGFVPAVSVHDLQQRLPSLTRGEGAVETAFEDYRPVSGAVPVRERTDADPLDREEYLLAVVRRVAGR